MVSLYPSVMYNEYPKGPPVIKKNLQNIFGIIKCKVLPPRKLYHPALPIKLKI